MADYLGKKIKFNIEDNDLQKIRFNKVYGESQQSTRSGKNLLDNTATTKISNGITFTVNSDGTVLADGTNDTSANSSLIINRYDLSPGTYILNGCPSGGASNTYRLAIQETGSYSILGSIDIGNGSGEFTIDTTTNVQIAIFIQKGLTVNNLLFKPMLRKATIADDTYEQYGASPSPDYPSEIESLEGENICPSLNTTRTINGVTFTKNKDGSITMNGTATADVTYPINVNTTTNTRTVLLKANSKYRMLSNYESGKYTTQVFYLKNNATTYATTYASSLIETVEETKAGMYIRVYKDAVLENVTIYPQITKGEEYKPYVPYNSLEFKDEGENLYNDNIDNYNKPIDYWICPVALEQGETYKLSGKLKGSKMTGCVVAVVPYGNSYSEFKDVVYRYTALNTSGVVSNRTITVDSSFTSPKLVIYANNKEIFKSIFGNYEIQLNKGTVMRPYKPYQGRKEYFPLSEGQKLMKKSYLADDGTHHIRKQYTFTGNEVITLSNRQYENCVCFYINNQNLINKQNNYITKEMCSHFAYDSLAYKENRDVECITDNTGVPYRLIIFQILKTRLTSIDEAGCKAYLSEQYANGTPVIVEYELAEEEIVPYTETQKEAWEKLRHFKGLNGENNITAQGTMTSTLDLTLYNVAEEDFDIYISKKGYFGALKYDINNLIDFMESNIPSIAEATESSVKIAGRDGDIPLNTVYEPLPFEIVCYTEDNLTPEEKIIEEQKITSLLNSIKNQTKTLFMEREKKFYKVKYSGNLSVVRYPKHLKFTIPLKSSESYAMNFEESEIIGNGTKVSNTIKDTGAIFTIKGPATKPIISLNNYQMKYNENILEGNSLIINSEDSTITHITSAGVKTNAMRAYNHEFPKIKNGENQLAVSSGIDDENQVNVKWYDLKI